MAKNDQKVVQGQIMTGRDDSARDYNDFLGSLYTPRSETWNRAAQDYSGAYAGYSSAAQNGGLNQADIDRLRGMAGGGGGGVSNPLAGKTSNLKDLTSAFASAYRPDYKESDSGYRTIKDTGGIDQTGINQDLSGLRGFGETGGITAEDDANINRDTLKEFEQTGGYSDADKTNIRARSSASSPAFFQNLKNNIAQNRNITGNYAGAGAVNFQLAREQAKQENENRINTEIGLADSIRSGRMSASDLLAKNYLQEVGLRTNNQLRGLESAGSLDLGTQGLISSNKLAALQGLADSQTNLGQWGLGQASGLDSFGLTKAQGLDQWDINNAQLQQSADASNAAASRASAAQSLGLEQWLLDYQNGNKQWGTEGLDDLYKTNLGANLDYSGMNLDALNSANQSNQGYLGLAAQNRSKTGMENFMQLSSSLAGLGAGIATGSAPIGGVRQPNQIGAPNLDPNNPYAGWM